MAGLLVIADKTITVEPGAEATCVCRIKNTGTVVDQFSLQVLGVAAAFNASEPPSLSLFPGAEGEIILHLKPPATQRAGKVPLGVKLVSAVEPQTTVVEESTLQIGAFVAVTARLVPRVKKGRSVGKHTLTLRNTGNAPTRVRINGSDPDDLIRFRGLGGSPIVLAPGAPHRMKLRYRSTASHMMGPPENHEFTLSVVPEGGDPVPVQGSFLQRAAISGWIPKAVVAVLALIVLVLILKQLQSGNIKSQAKGDSAGIAGATTTTSATATGTPTPAPTTPAATTSTASQGPNNPGPKPPAPPPPPPTATPKPLTPNVPPPAQPPTVQASVPLLFAHTTGLSSGDVETVAGGNEANVTNNPVLNYQSPSYSPDGTRVAFSGRDAGNQNARDLYLGDKNLAGASPIVLGCGCSQVAWSYDASLIAFVNGSTIEVVPPQGGVPPHVVLTAAAPINSIAWTRDSQKIAFGAGGQLAWVGRNGGSSTPMASGSLVAGVSFSPDGKSVVFAMAPSGSGNPQIFIASIDPSLAVSNQRAAVTAGTNQFPKWSRDGKTIYFGGTGGAAPNFELWSMPAAGGAPVQLTHSATAPGSGNVSSNQPEG